MNGLIYNKTIKNEGNDCLITKNAHVLSVDDLFVITVTIIYTGWMGVDSRSSSYVYANEEEAIEFCKGYLGE